MSKVKDRLWIWGHDAGTHNNVYGIGGSSRITPAEGAYYLGIPNIIMVRFSDKSVDSFQYAMALSPLNRVVWSIAGGVGHGGFDEIELVCKLGMRFPNICGVMMDDFFRGVDKKGNQDAAFTPDQLKDIRKKLFVSGRKLDIWAVLYDHQLNFPVKKHLEQCDVVNFWTWKATEIENLERNFERVEKLAPSCQKVLGCYMYDYGADKPMPVSLMEKQCQLGLRWLKEGRIEGMVFLASCICDLNFEAVEWTRQFIRNVGETTIKPHC